MRSELRYKGRERIGLTEVKDGAGHRGTEALITSERSVCRLHEMPPFRNPITALRE